MIPLFKVAMSEDAGRRVNDVLFSGYIGEGPRVKEFEEELRRRIGNPALATVNSCTSALHLALHMVAGEAQRSQAGSTGQGEVLTTPLTCTATNWPILANGLRIGWVDVDPATLNVDLDDLARKIGPDTRAIIVVHWAGYPVDLDRLRQILDDAEAAFGFRPVVIEDCAHAWGSTYKGKPLGNHGNICAFSFQAIKHLTTGDGGLLVLPSQEQADRARLLRWYGLDRSKGESFRCEQDVPEYGFKFHMNDISAAIGLANLGQVDAHVERHRQNAAYYDRELKEVPGLKLTERADDRESAFWIYSILVDRRDDFIERMKSHGVMASPVHQRNDGQRPVAQYRRLLPGLDSVADRQVSIPVGWWVTDEDRQHIVDTIRGGW
jgi:dTDP-4-amino-4,6-dideoxygalactose transaminase